MNSDAETFKVYAEGHEAAEVCGNPRSDEETGDPGVFNDFI